MPGPPLEIRSNDSRQDCFSTATRSGTWSVPTSARAPSARPLQSASAWPGPAERRRDDEPGGLLGRQVIARRRRASGSAGRSRRRPAGRRPGAPGRGPAPRRRRGARHRAAPAAPRARATARAVASASTYGGRERGMEARCRLARGEVSRGQRVEHDRFSQWTSSMPPLAPAVARARSSGPIVDPEVVDHEGLERRHPGSMAVGSSAIGSSWAAVMTRLSADSRRPLSAVGR